MNAVFWGHRSVIVRGGKILSKQKDLQYHRWKFYFEGVTEFCSCSSFLVPVRVS